MFQEKALLFLYCVSPVHPGAGTSLGAVDNPIQRERHTFHPTMAGSGIKGALRDHCGGHDPDDVLTVFGPEPGSSLDHAGAISFSDAQVILFPVRSLKESFFYATSPTALAQFQRLARLAGYDEVDAWDIPRPGEGECIPLAEMEDPRIILESFEFEKASLTEGAKGISNFLADHCIRTEAHWLSFFHEKIAGHTLVLSDAEFTHFVKHATLVEPHVRIEDRTGTAQEGGLFYVDNLPPETLMVSLVMASKSRRMNRDLEAWKIVELLESWLEDDDLAQIGGDSTTGRGQVLLKLSSKSRKAV